MNTTQTPTTDTASQLPKPGSPRRWRYVLTGLVVFAATIALFYVEENWRGRRAWENCKRELEAKGAKLDWNYYIPPPVPDDQNIFGVPEMQKWFEYRGPTELSKKLISPASWKHPEVRVVVANLTIGRPGEIAPGGSSVLQWSEPESAHAKAVRLMNQAFGPMGKDPADPGQDFDYMGKKPDEVRPAQILLQCQTAPTAKELESFFSKKPGSRPVRLESSGLNSYRVTMDALSSAADYVAWGETIEPDLAIIRRTVQRPFARMAGDYRTPIDMPVPNFVTLRNVSQRLAALAECYLALGQPDKALDQMTLIHQLCRMLEGRPTSRPMTLVAAMINVAISGLYVNTINDGLQMKAWGEPQLAALQQQLQEIKLQPYVMAAIANEQAFICTDAEITPTIRIPEVIFGKPLKHPNFSIYRLIPRGWVYQNMVVCANIHQIINESLDPANQGVTPHKLEASSKVVDSEYSHGLLWSPFKFLASVATPNYIRASRTLAHNQTLANQAQIVCALERFHLAHGEYPAALENLKPQFIAEIPSDIIGGQPPHYGRTEDGKFLLYSIAWSEKDHGGKSGSNDTGDWVWGED